MNLYHPNCYDADSCGFFFDGYAMEMTFTNNSSIRDWGADDDFYACTMPLEEDDTWMINDAITYYSTIPTSWGDLYDFLSYEAGGDKFFQCGTTAESLISEIVNRNEIGYTNVLLHPWGFEYDVPSPYGWLNEQDQQQMSTGFGDWQFDYASATSAGGDWTSLRWTQYVIADYHPGMPHNWRYPRGVGRYNYGWIPVYIKGDSGNNDFRLIRVGGATNAAILTAGALLATLAAITN